MRESDWVGTLRIVNLGRLLLVQHLSFDLDDKKEWATTQEYLWNKHLRQRGCLCKGPGVRVNLSCPKNRKRAWGARMQSQVECGGTGGRGDPGHPEGL